MAIASSVATPSKSSKILLLGAGGQVGQEVQSLVQLTTEAAPSIEVLDITDHKALKDYIQNFTPQVVINCAAYTAVDRAESERELARAVNAVALETIALECQRCSARLIHLSTDYVFHGQGSVPFREFDAVSPLNFYGRSRREGEILARLCPQAVIVRTSSVHGQYGPNFVHTMLKLFAEKSEVRVVDDQFMTPTWAGWLAQVLVALAASPKKLPSVLHCAGSGVVSWYQFASEILEMVKPSLEQIPELLAIPSSDYPTPAKRPRYSVLDCSLLCKTLSTEQIAWQVGLRNHLAQLGYTDLSHVA